MTALNAARVGAVEELPRVSAALTDGVASSRGARSDRGRPGARFTGNRPPPGTATSVEVRMRTVARRVVDVEGASGSAPRFGVTRRGSRRRIVRAPPDGVRKCVARRLVPRGRPSPRRRRKASAPLPARWRSEPLHSRRIGCGELPLAGGCRARRARRTWTRLPRAQLELQPRTRAPCLGETAKNRSPDRGRERGHRRERGAGSAKACAAMRARAGRRSRATTGTATARRGFDPDGQHLARHRDPFDALPRSSSCRRRRHRRPRGHARHG